MRKERSWADSDAPVRVPTVGRPVAWSSTPASRSLEATRQELSGLRGGPCRARHGLMRRSAASTPSLLTLSSPPASPATPLVRQSPARTPRVPPPLLARTPPACSPTASLERTPPRRCRAASANATLQAAPSGHDAEGPVDGGATTANDAGTAATACAGAAPDGCASIRRRPHSAGPGRPGFFQTCCRRTSSWRPCLSGSPSTPPSSRRVRRASTPPPVPPWPFVTSSGGKLEAHNSWLSAVGTIPLPSASSTSRSGRGGGTCPRRRLPTRRARSAPARRQRGCSLEPTCGGRGARSPGRGVGKVTAIAAKPVLDPLYVLALERELVRLRSENLRLRQASGAPAPHSARRGRVNASGGTVV